MAEQNYIFVDSILLLAFIVSIAVFLFHKWEFKGKQRDINPSCNHDFKTVESINMYDTSFGSKRYMHTEKHCKCNKCGIWIKIKL